MANCSLRLRRDFLKIQHKLKIIEIATKAIATPITASPVVVYTHPGADCGAEDEVVAETLVVV